MARILVIEDNPSNMKLVSMILEARGHKVIEAHAAIEGIRLAHAESPQLILMDIQLPGMDGLEATRRLKADPATQGITVVALTAFVRKGDEAHMRAAGCDDYIPKPIRHTDFIERVSGLLSPG